MIDDIRVYALAPEGWRQIPWDAWLQFRCGGELGAFRGETYFIVLVLDDDGTVANALPHRYLLSDGGRMMDRISTWSDEDLRLYNAYYAGRVLALEEDEKVTKLMERDYQLSLPPLDAVHSFLRRLPGPIKPGLGFDHFLRAVGIDPAAWDPSARRQ
jgi:hypothetical protein